jgi:hypothetical protein
MADLLESFQLLKAWPDDAGCREQRKAFAREILESRIGSPEDLNEAAELWMAEAADLCFESVAEAIADLDEQQANGLITYWTARERERSLTAFQRIAAAHGVDRKLSVARREPPQAKLEHVVEIATDGGVIGLGARRRVAAARATNTELEDKGILRIDTGGDGRFDVVVRVVDGPSAKGIPLELEDGRLLLFGIGFSEAEVVVPPGGYRANARAQRGRFLVELRRSEERINSGRG